MTTEEKAKAYDEALKWMRELYPGLHGATKEDAEHYFPELRESEDEKIREDLIGGLMWQRDNLDRLGKHDDSLILPRFCRTVGEHLAYLEKQEEHKSVEHFDLTKLIVPAQLPKERKPVKYLDKDKVFAIMTKLNNLSFSTRIPIDSDEYKKIDEITSDVLKLLDYPIEQKPAEWDELQADFRNINEAFEDGKKEVVGHPEMYGLCKPAEWSEDWREEDIQTRFAFYTYKDDPSVLYLSNVFVEEASRNHGFGTRILRAAEKVAETIGATTISLKVKHDSPVNAWYRKNGYGYVAFEDGYDWLEKNLEYMKPKEPEWSEEDEKMRNSIIADYERSNKEWFAAQCSIPWGKKIDWLKSRCNKPSAEHCQPTVSDLAIKFMNYLDRNRPEGKMCLSNGECEDINEAFKKNDLDRIMRYVRKYSWRPSEEQMEWLESAVKLSTDKPHIHGIIISLYEQLKRL